MSHVRSRFRSRFIDGIASDDVITGMLVMGGGVVVGLALLLGRFGTSGSIFARPIRLAALRSWILSFATVVVAGYAIEMNETYFGQGDPSDSYPAFRVCLYHTFGARLPNR